MTRRSLILSGAGLLALRRAQATQTLWHFLATGQSLSNGFSGTPVLTTSQPVGYDNFTLSGSQEAGVSLAARTETVWGVESPSSAFAAQLTMMAGGGTSLQSLVTKHGQNGQPYVNLQRTPSAPGSPITGTGPYQLGQTQITNGRAAALAAGYGYQVGGIIITHGEAEIGFRTAADYAGYMKQMQADYEYDARLVTGVRRVPLFISACDPPGTDQIAVAPNYQDGLTLGQWWAARDNPGRIYLTGPKYHLTYNSAGTDVHLDNAGYRHLGEMDGRAVYRVCFLGWKCPTLSPRSIQRAGNIITCRFWVPVGNLALNTTLVGNRGPAYGFEYATAASWPNVAIAITNVALSGDTATLTLASTPSGVTGEKLRYAWASTAVGATRKPDGNICDQENVAGALSGDVVPNFATAFSEPIGFEWAPSAGMFPLPSTIDR